MMNVRTPDGDLLPLLEQLDDILAWRNEHTQAPDDRLEWFNRSQVACVSESMNAPVQEAFSVPGIYTNIRAPVLLQSEEAMTRDMNALSITLLGTADSIALPSTDGQDGTLDKLNSPCPWMSDDSDDNEGSQLSVIDEDLTVRYSRLRAEARTLM
jgi:hypothetical protein